MRLVKPISVEPHRISHLMNECIQMHEIKKKIFQSQHYAHSSLRFGTAQHDKSFVLIKPKRRSKSKLSRTQISMVRRGAARLIKRALVDASVVNKDRFCNKYNGNSCFN